MHSKAACSSKTVSGGPKSQLCLRHFTSLNLIFLVCMIGVILLLHRVVVRVKCDCVQIHYDPEWVNGRILACHVGDPGSIA